MADTPIAPFILFPVVFIIVWLFVSAAISRVGGWSTLAEQFRFTGQFYGPQWKWQSAQMRSTMNYNGCLILGCNPTGLYLWTIPICRFRHPPLLIPWNEIAVSSNKRILFMDFVRLKLGRESQIPFLIPASRAEKIKAVAGKHWPVESRD